jgi:hypothetical protein
MGLRSGHRNRSKPPFKLRKRDALSFSDWMPTRECKDCHRPRPATAGEGCGSGSSHPGLRFRPAPHLSHHRRSSPVHAAGFARACARLTARDHPSVGARARVRRQAREAAHRRRKSTLDPHHQADHNQPRSIEMAIRAGSCEFQNKAMRPTIVKARAGKDMHLIDALGHNSGDARLQVRRLPQLRA